MFVGVQNSVSGTQFDLNHDGEVDSDDVRVLVENILNTRFGDSDLDGKFLVSIGLQWRRIKCVKMPSNCWPAILFSLREIGERGNRL